MVLLELIVGATPLFHQAVYQSGSSLLSLCQDAIFFWSDLAPRPQFAGQARTMTRLLASHQHDEEELLVQLVAGLLSLTLVRMTSKGILTILRLTLKGKLQDFLAYIMSSRLRLLNCCLPASGAVLINVCKGIGETATLQAFWAGKQSN